MIMIFFFSVMMFLFCFVLFFLWRKPFEHQSLTLEIKANINNTVEPRYNEGSRDWPNVCAITRFRYIERFVSLYFTIRGVKKIIRYTEDFVI